jgi:hypothetical protein
MGCGAAAASFSVDASSVVRQTTPMIANPARLSAAMRPLKAPSLVVDGRRLMAAGAVES